MTKGNQTKHKGKEKEKKGQTLLPRFYFHFPGITKWLCWCQAEMEMAMGVGVGKGIELEDVALELFTGGGKELKVKQPTLISVTRFPLPFCGLTIAVSKQGYHAAQPVGGIIYECHVNSPGIVQPTAQQTNKFLLELKVFALKNKQTNKK